MTFFLFYEIMRNKCLLLFCLYFFNGCSGLDSSTSTQVVLLLKQLAAEGRTIVCSIHQPSALLFGLFDHLYAMAEGQCIYAGATGMLVPFLSELELICPKTYNPCDYCKQSMKFNEIKIHEGIVLMRICISQY